MLGQHAAAHQSREKTAIPGRLTTSLYIPACAISARCPTLKQTHQTVGEWQGDKGQHSGQGDGGGV